MKYIKISGIVFLLLATLGAMAQVKKGGFKIIPLGVQGGLNESNLSAYLVAAKDSNQFICFDAGTIRTGLQKAIDQHLFKQQDVNALQKEIINSYFISHGHLDHTAGLVLNSPNDNKKNIYALPSVIDVFKSSLFGSKSWSNFGNEGDLPIIGKYSYQYLVPGQEIEVPLTGLYVTPFVLSHAKPYESTAFLVRHEEEYILYFGDTGPDEVEHANNLELVWKSIAPFIKAGKLKAIFIEVSFANKVPDKALFGHLTPDWLMKEMQQLHSFSNDNLKSVPIYITHIKPCIDCAYTIQKELNKENKLGLKLLFPEQAKLIQLP